MSDNPLDRILAKLDALEASQRQVEASLRQVEAGQRQVEAGQTQLRIDLMGRMERLGDDIGRIRDDIGVNMGRADRAIEAADHMRDELRSLGSEIAAMWRKVNRLESDVRDLHSRP
jgi:archaellum component FlaC